jgi:NitT/TauT family transport system ATP-binding protein
MSQRYDIPLSRPRKLMATRSDPRFAPLLQRLWDDLSREVDRTAAEAA